MALFYISANLLNIQLNKRQLDSHSCFCIQSVLTSHNTSLACGNCTLKRIKVEKVNNVLVLLEKYCDFMDTLKLLP